MTRSWPRRAACVLVTAWLVAACGGSDAATTGAGITRATAIATERPAPAATASAPAAAATPAAPLPADPAISAWADSVCEVTARFDEAVAAVQDGIDPRTLSVPERLARADARYSAYIASLGAQAAALDAITPPDAAGRYHAALRAQVSELERIFGEQLTLFDGAVLASEIEDANAALDNEVSRLENSLALVHSLLADAVQAALAAPERCGALLG